MNNKPPKNWKRVTLGELLDYERPDKYIVSSEDYSDSYKTPVLTAGKTFILGYTNDTEGIYKNLPVIIFDDFTTESKYVDFDFKVKSSAMKMLKAENNITLKYLYYLMQTLSFNHDTHKRYWISEYSKLKIDIPDKIEEQQEIVQVLDTMSDIIRLRKECISHAQDLIPALFQKMFKNYENNTILLSSICDIKGGKRLPSGEKLIDAKTEHPYLRVTNFKNQNIDMNDIKYITEDVYKKISRYVITTGDIYISIAGTIGLVGDIPNELNNANLTENAARLIIDKKKVNKKYLIYCLNSTFLQQQIKEATVGVGVPKLALSRIGTLKIYLPDIKIQEQFAQKAIEIEAYIKEQNEELENAKQMFQSLLHHAFTGELTRRAYGKD